MATISALLGTTMTTKPHKITPSPSTTSTPTNNSVSTSSPTKSSRSNTGIGSIYNVSSSTSTNRNKSTPSHSSLYTVSNFAPVPRTQNPTEPQSTVSVLTPIPNDTVKSISEYLPELQSKQIISDITCQNEIDSFDPNDDESALNVLNDITSALTQKLLSFNMNPNPYPKITNKSQYDYSYNYAKVRKQRLSLIHGYCDQDNDYIFSTDLKLLIFAYCNSMLSWSISGEAMKQFRNAEHRQVMIGPQLGLEGATLALTIYPQGWSSRAKGYVGIYLELINKNDPDEIIEYIQASVTIWVKELDLMYKTSMFLRRVGGAVGIDSQMLLFDDIIKMDAFTFEADIDIQGIKYKQETNIPPRIVSNVPIITDTEFMWNIDDDILKIMKYSKDRSVNYSDMFGDDCMLLELKRARCTNKLCLKLLRMPLDVMYYVTDIMWSIYYDNQRVIIKQENVVVKVFRSVAMPNVGEFSLNHMEKVNVLSFKVEIKVKEIKRY